MVLKEVQRKRKHGPALVLSQKGPRPLVNRERSDMSAIFKWAFTLAFVLLLVNVLLLIGLLTVIM